MLFRQIAYYALLIGALTGLVVTAVQYWQVVPIIQSAEFFEGQAITSEFTHGHEGTTQEHLHLDQLWAPENGVERSIYTLLSNIFVAMGFSMILLAVIIFALRAKVITKFSLKHGLLFATAGYSIFFLAPSLGLPPEIPLTNSALVETRQLWWLLAVLFTSAGFAVLLFIKSSWRWLSILLLVIPHLTTVPHISEYMFAGQPVVASVKLEQLAQQFIGATAIVNAVLWLVLGVLSTWVVQRIMTLLNMEKQSF